MDLPKMKPCDMILYGYLLQMVVAVTPETYRCRSMAKLTSAKTLPLAGARVFNCSANFVTEVHYMD
jgi:hypothetical protein